MNTRRRTTREAITPATRPRPATSVVVDLDHTIANAYWRDALIGRWDEYYSAGIDDLPFPWVHDLLMFLHDTGLYNIVCITARPEKWRMLSMKWMLKHRIPIDELLMRPDGDHRPSSEVKPELIRGRFPDLNEIAFALEDRTEVCEALLEMGINVLQVHRGRNRDADRERPTLSSVDNRDAARGQRDGRGGKSRRDPRHGGPGRQHRLA